MNGRDITARFISVRAEENLGNHEWDRQMLVQPAGLVRKNDFDGTDGPLGAERRSPPQKESPEQTAGNEVCPGLDGG